MLKAIFLAFAIASVALLSTSESKSVGDSEVPILIQRQILSQLRALKYGDHCSWQVEQIRQNYSRPTSSSEGDRKALIELLDNVYENGWTLCSSAELYVCDKESQKCVCGDPGYEAQFGVARDLYTVEGNGKCRWNTDTYCIPADMTPSSDNAPGLKMDAGCRSGTSCSLRDGQACSKMGMIHNLVNNYDADFFTNRANLFKAFASGEICSCKRDQGGQYQDQGQIGKVEPTHLQFDTLDQNENSVFRGRGRRSASSDDLDLGSLVKYVSGASVSQDLY